MKRLLFGVLALLAPVLVMAGTSAQSFDEGIEYQRIDPPVPTDSGHKVEVVEFFWYGCPHCYHFEPELDKWLAHKPKDVEFKRIPAILGSRWAPLARAFYTEKLLGVFDKTHQALFDAIHKDRRLKLLRDEGALADFFAQHGVSKDKFRSTYNSFAVDMDVRRARDLTQRYGIDGVPSMAVAGRYRTSGQLAGDNQRMLDVVDFLVRKERSASSGAASGE
ncbi:MAG TPA: thiol:disulfide interchange protein DsbA/DsbL [Gammaproteobacteria bacterium]|nr:thiol:disulfide interchange protein DsbA/DsbL [Gammaproteobacteria bacterium]